MVTVLVGKYDVWIPLYPIVALGACLYAGFTCHQGTFDRVFLEYYMNLVLQFLNDLWESNNKLAAFQ